MDSRPMTPSHTRACRPIFPTPHNTFRCGAGWQPAAGSPTPPRALKARIRLHHPFSPRTDPWRMQSCMPRRQSCRRLFFPWLRLRCSVLPARNFVAARNHFRCGAGCQPAAGSPTPPRALKARIRPHHRSHVGQPFLAAAAFPGGHNRPPRGASSTKPFNSNPEPPSAHLPHPNQPKPSNTITNRMAPQ